MYNSNLFDFNDILLDNIDMLLTKFGVDYYEDYESIRGPCPIHGGDNRTSFLIYTESGCWKCFSHLCHTKYGGNMFGLVRALLSTKQNNIVSTTETIKYILQLLNLTEEDLKKNIADLEKRKFNQQASILFNNNTIVSTPNMQRETVRQNLHIPSEYYLTRDYSTDILKRYDVGDCVRDNFPMSGRAVVPIYDDQHKYMIGCSGRSLNGDMPKWKHSKNFQANHFLYNLWYAKDEILKSQTAILVESPGNVWRLEENGIHNSLALFGCELSQQQENILSTLGILSLIIIMDNDTNRAGQIAYEKIYKKLYKMYRIFTPDIHSADVGEMSSDEVTTEIKPLIKHVNSIYSI